MEGHSKEDQAQSTKLPSDYMSNLRRSGRNRESHDEIAELEAELRKAYVAKDLRAQFIERETERYIENVRKQRASKLMCLEQEASLANDRLRKSEDHRKSEDYRRQLTEQIARKKEERDLVMAEARREREILTEVDRIREQCDRSKTLETRRELAESTRRERLILEEMKEVRRHEEMEAETKKLLEDQEYLNEIGQRAKESKAIREERERNREHVVREIARILVNVETRKMEREMLIGELMAEDVKRELVIREEEEFARRMKMREELAADLEEQIVFTEQCKLRFVEQDKAFAEEVMSRIMEDERTARLTAEARRRVQLQYKEDLIRLIEKRRQIREEEIIKMKRDAEEENWRERIYEERVRGERRRLLEKHASNIVEFLDKSALSGEEIEIVEKSVQKGG